MIVPVPDYGHSFMQVDRPAAFSKPGDRKEARGLIATRQREMMASPDRVELEFIETLLDGLYTRTLFIPKGCELIGKIHKKPCVNIVATGDISIMTETGALRVQAGYSVTSPAGIQKVGYAHEDTIFINVFRTDETDISKIEADLIAESFEALECAQENLCLG